MTCAPIITKVDLEQRKGALAFLETNFDKLTRETEHYPVVFRLGDFRTLFRSRDDIQSLIERLKAATSAPS